MDKPKQTPPSAMAEPEPAAAAADGVGPGERLRVVVTGGSRGIGRSTVHSFARRGHKVIFSYNTSTVEECTAVVAAYLPGHVTAVKLDQGTYQSVVEFGMAVDTWRAGHPIDVLVNNAGLGSATVKRYPGLDKRYTADTAGTDATDATEGTAAPLGPSAAPGAPGTAMATRGGGAAVTTGMMAGPFFGAADPQTAPHDADPTAPPVLPASSPLDKYHDAMYDEALMRVNSLGPLWVTTVLLPALTKAPGPDTRGSVVLFIGSVGGGSQSVFPGFRFSDAMSKAAIAQVCKLLAAEHAHKNIDFMCLNPGAVMTDMFRSSTLDRMPRPEEFVSQLPKRRMIKPDEIAESVYWLCTFPAARIFHGAVIDGSQGLATRPGLLTEFDPYAS